eukprot:TRINITY_DN8082_c3_g1_i1.p1 TRINITY_DN8082_c3_g1~~TRINITY_DN8082_c3_g1_i1.p1  ORF type:complete len:357 (-),score=-23.34 TRINITY_DN8082_c3_g1_i1:332-1402(-)
MLQFSCNKVQGARKIYLLQLNNLQIQPIFTEVTSVFDHYMQNDVMKKQTLSKLSAPILLESFLVKYCLIGDQNRANWEIRILFLCANHQFQSPKITQTLRQLLFLDRYVHGYIYLVLKNSVLDAEIRYSIPPIVKIPVIRTLAWVLTEFHWLYIKNVTLHYGISQKQALQQERFVKIFNFKAAYVIQKAMYFWQIFHGKNKVWLIFFFLQCFILINKVAYLYQCCIDVSIIENSDYNIMCSNFEMQWYRFILNKINNYRVIKSINPLNQFRIQALFIIYIFYRIKLNFFIQKNVNLVVFSAVDILAGSFINAEIIRTGICCRYLICLVQQNYTLLVIISQLYYPSITLKSILSKKQ